MRNVTLTLLAVLVCAHAAHAQDAGTHGMIVRVDEDELVLDVGTSNVHVGDVLPMYRPVEVRHPVTRQVLRDRFFIGQVRVEQAGPSLSLVRPVAQPARAPGIGDVVDVPRLVAATPATPPVTPSAPPDHAPPSDHVHTTHADEQPAAPQTDPETAAVMALFQQTLGRPPAERIRLYGAYVEQHPQTPYRAALVQDAQLLNDLRQHATPEPTAEQLAGRQREALSTLSHIDRVTGWHPGQVPEIGVQSPPTLARTVVLYARATGTTQYVAHRAPIGADGTARIALPVEVDHGDGIQYFVEVVGRDGVTMWVGASAEDPWTAHGIPTDLPDSTGRSRARFSSEMVSFSTNALNDWYLDVEADFLYRLQAGPLYGVRVGFLTLYGQGGTVHDLDVLGSAAHTAGFTAGYLELEVRPFDGFGVIGRFGVGLNRPDEAEAQPASLAPGGQLRVRIGDERGVNLQLGGEIIPQLGQRAFVALAWELLRGFPMAAEVHVTNQPVTAGDIGVRVVLEMGWRITPYAQLSLRLSGQGRQIDHVGPGVGFAATFDW